MPTQIKMMKILVLFSMAIMHASGGADWITSKSWVDGGQDHHHHAGQDNLGDNVYGVHETPHGSSQYDQEETSNIKSAEEEGHFSHPLISLERTQDQDLRLEINDFLKKMLIVIGHPHTHEKRSTPEFRRAQYILSSLCSRLRAVESMTEWYPVFSFNNHNKITEQDYRIIQICKSIGLKRSGGHQRPVDQDGTKKTFGKMFMRM